MKGCLISTVSVAGMLATFTLLATGGMCIAGRLPSYQAKWWILGGGAVLLAGQVSMGQHPFSKENKSYNILYNLTALTVITLGLCNYFGVLPTKQMSIGAVTSAVAYILLFGKEEDITSYYGQPWKSSSKLPASPSQSGLNVVSVRQSRAFLEYLSRLPAPQNLSGTQNPVSSHGSAQEAH